MMVPKRFFERLPAAMDRDRRMHAAVVEALDESIGSVLATLKQRGFENTIVFFQSDNGATREARADHAGTRVSRRIERYLSRVEREFV